MVKTYRFRIVPRPQQEAILHRYINACRFVWNAGIEYNNMRRARGYPTVGYMKPKEGLGAQFVALRNSEGFEWLKEIPYEIARYPMKRLDDAQRAAFARLKKGDGAASFPRFHRRAAEGSFTIPTVIARSIGERAIRIPSVANKGKFWIKMRPHKRAGQCEIEGTAKQVVIKNEGNRWFAYIQCDLGAVPVPVHMGGAVGTHLGVSKTLTLSDGTIFQQPHNMRKEARRKRYQRIMARKVNMALNSVGWDGKSGTRRTAEAALGRLRKQQAEEKGGGRLPHYSRRYDIVKARAAKVSRDLQNIRKNTCHQISSAITHKYAHVVMEDLQIKNMTKAMKVTVELPSGRVVQKSELNRAILANGWGIVGGMIEYKANWRGGLVEKVSPRYTSQTCNSCGAINKENRNSQSRFECGCCGFVADADVNAAKNILIKANLIARDKDAKARERCDGDSCRQPAKSNLGRSERDSGTSPEVT